MSESDFLCMVICSCLRIIFYTKMIASFPETCAILDSQHHAEITAQIYGGICFSQTPPHDFYCHPLFRFRHVILI